MPMPTRLDTNFAHLSNDNEFESMIRDICAREWQDPYTEKHGRTGQKQYGVDIYGRPIDLEGRYRAAQCKLRTTQKQLSQQEITQEVSAARGFPHPLETLLIVTDTPRDIHTQRLIEHVSQREQQNNGFRVAIWFWDDITERLASYPPLIVKYYPEYFANLTTLPLVERLIDTPLQVLSVTWPPLPLLTALEEYLQFRGIRLLKPLGSEHGAPHAPWDKGLPDGILCHYAASLEEATPSNMLRFAGHVLRYLPESPQACPMFVVLPFSLREVFVQSVATLGGDLRTMHMLSDEVSSEAERKSHLTSSL